MTDRSLTASSGSSRDTSYGNPRGAVLGAALGGFCWIGVAGIAISSFFLIGLYLGMALGTIAAFLRLFRQLSGRHQAVSGLLVIHCAVANLAVFAAIKERIPETAFGISTGAGGVAELLVPPALLILALVGVRSVVVDLRRTG